MTTDRGTFCPIVGGPCKREACQAWRGGDCVVFRALEVALGPEGLLARAPDALVSSPGPQASKSLGKAPGGTPPKRQAGAAGASSRDRGGAGGSPGTKTPEAKTPEAMIPVAPPARPADQLADILQDIRAVYGQAPVTIDDILEIAEGEGFTAKMLQPLLEELQGRGVVRLTSEGILVLAPPKSRDTGE